MDPPGPLKAHPLSVTPPPADEADVEPINKAPVSSRGGGGHPVLRVRVVVDPPPTPPAPAARAEEAAAGAATAAIVASSAAGAGAATAARPLVRVAGHPVVTADAAATAIVWTPYANSSSAAAGTSLAWPLERARRAAALVLAASIYPLGVLFVASYVLIALVAACAITACVWPSLLLAARLYEALPFARAAFASPSGPVRRRLGPAAALLARLSFEAGHCAAVLGRVLTLPLRPALPTFYIAGLAKCGTTTLAAYLRRENRRRGERGPRFVFPAGALPFAPEPADDAAETRLLSLAGLAEAASKETHYLTGVLGAGGAPSALLYRSFYPLFAGCAWWRLAFWRGAAERCLGVAAPAAPPFAGARRRRDGDVGAAAAEAVVVVDATPTYAALPFVAQRVRRLTPNARVAVVVRDPVDALASAEGMLRALGAVPADEGWGLAGAGVAASGGSARDEEAAAPCDRDADEEDPRFADLRAASELWREMERLPADAPVPRRVARRMCALDRRAGLGGPCEAAKAGQRVAHLARVLGPENVMVVPFADLVEAPERVVADVAEFAAGGGGGGGARRKQQHQERERGGDGNFRPIGARMAGSLGAGGGGGGGGKAGGAPPPRVHPAVRARLEREVFAESAALLGELTGVDPRVLLRRPGGGSS
jgi:hypothetical protein